MEMDAVLVKFGEEKTKTTILGPVKDKRLAVSSNLQSTSLFKSRMKIPVDTYSVFKDCCTKIHSLVSLHILLMVELTYYPDEQQINTLTQTAVT